MLIPILRTNNYYDFVKGFLLDSLLEAKQVLKFKRKSGWVVIGNDVIRQQNRKSQYGLFTGRSAHVREVRECP
jgi:hypothetical protein